MTMARVVSLLGRNVAFYEICPGRKYQNAIDHNTSVAITSVVLFCQAVTTITRHRRNRRDVGAAPTRATTSKDLVSSTTKAAGSVPSATSGTPKETGESLVVHPRKSEFIVK